MLSLKGVRHRYGAREALRLEHFAAAQGEKWLVLGPSGSGKSTLLHILAGLLAPSEGSVEVARPIGIVPQKLHLIASLTVEQNLLLAQYLAGAREEPARAAQVLAGVGLAERAQARPRELSHGQSAAAQSVRTERYMASKTVFALIGITFVAMAGLYISFAGAKAGITAAIVMLIAGFFFCVVSGYLVGMIGVVLFATTTLFTLITLPVEFDASKRALATLQSGGYVSTEEWTGAKKVLDAAAWTYVAAAVSAILQLAYWALHLFGGSRDE